MDRRRRLDGSLWHKWDLHVHTPASIVHSYPGDDDAAWEAFLCDVENLPSDYKVLGINDYLFIDGYEKILSKVGQDRVANIEMFLPVIELRLNVFGGTDSSLSKVNYHVIFSDEIPPQVIRDQFISRLTGQFQLNPKYTGTSIENAWEGVISRHAVQNLGEAIIE